MIPEFQKFLYPTLQYLSDGKQATHKQIMEFLIQHFKFTPEEIAETTSKGTDTKVRDRENWAVTYLSQAGLVHHPKRGLAQITQTGIDYLKIKKDAITVDDLMGFESFRAFQNRRRQSKVGTEAKPVEVDNTKTPNEKLILAYEEINNSLASQLLEKVMQMDPKDFEKLVLNLLLAMGYGGEFEGAGLVTPYKKDGGIDGIINEDRLGLEKIGIQAKHYKTSNVQGQEIQSFIGALHTNGISKGIFITTSDFSAKAKEYAISNQKLILINGESLCQYMIKFNVGVSIRSTLEIKTLDNDYFDEL